MESCIERKSSFWFLLLNIQKTLKIKRVDISFIIVIKLKWNKKWNKLDVQQAANDKGYLGFAKENIMVNKYLRKPSFRSKKKHAINLISYFMNFSLKQVHRISYLIRYNYLFRLKS